MKKHLFAVSAFAFIFGAMPIIGKAQTCSTAGCLDTTFGIGGKVVTSLNSGTGKGRAKAVAIQPADDKIVVAAQKLAEGTGTDFYVLRYNQDGSLDATFGIGGITSFNFSSDPTDHEYPHAIAIQPDGKIVVGGYVPAISSSGIARLNSDGNLDSTFGTNGKITLAFARNETAEIRAIVVQPNEYIAVAGNSNNNSFAFARFKPNGSLDTTFNKTGKLVVRGSNAKLGTATDLKVQADGKLVAVGSGSPKGSDAMFTVIRVNANGTLDSNFGSGGHVFTNFGGAWSLATSLALDFAGRIVVGGVFVKVANSDEYFAFARYHSNNGQLDYSFGSSGKFTAAGSPGFNRLWGLFIQADGKIVGGGIHHAPNLPDDFAVLRLNPDAGLDISFGNGGISLTDFGGNSDRLSNIAVQSDGKIVAAGSANDFTSTVSLGLARYVP